MNSLQSLLSPATPLDANPQRPNQPEFVALALETPPGRTPANHWTTPGPCRCRPSATQPEVRYSRDVKKFLTFGVQMNFPASAALSIHSPRTQSNGAASHWETKGRHPCLGPPLPAGSRTAFYNQVLVDLRRPPPSPIPPVALLGPQALPKEGGAQHHAGRAIVSLHPKQPPYLPSNSNSNSRGKESRGQPA